MGYGRLNAGNALVLTHDNYKQHQTETGTKVFSSPHQTFAGYHISDIIPLGNYDISSGANISFYSPEAINLSPGFIAEAGSVFLGTIGTRCNHADIHYKPESPIRKNKNSNHFDDVTIYPNPAHDKLNIDFILSHDDNVSFTVSNILGQQLSTVTNVSFKAGKQTQMLVTQSLLPGVYLITIKTDKGLSQFKFVKE